MTNSNLDNKSIAESQQLQHIIAERWSPRSFQKKPIPETDIQLLFEAARRAPSCFNEQPWQFYLSSEKSFDTFVSLLDEGNQVWAKHASLLCFAVHRTQFKLNGKENRHAAFDTGAAWMSLTIQARHMGLYTHGMGGILYDEVAKYFKLAADQRVCCGIAIGYIDSPDKLPAELAAKEKPKGRKPMDEVLIRY